MLFTMYQKSISNLTLVVASASGLNLKTYPDDQIIKESEYHMRVGYICL